MGVSVAKPQLEEGLISYQPARLPPFLQSCSGTPVSSDYFPPLQAVAVKKLVHPDPDVGGSDDHHLLAHQHTPI